MIVVYDAHCLLCSGSIQFLLRHDRQGVLRFASMQGKTGRQLVRPLLHLHPAAARRSTAVSGLSVAAQCCRQKSSISAATCSG